MNEITLEFYETYKRDIESIIEVSEDAVDNFLNLGRLFKKINQEQTYKLEDYKDIYEFAEDKFGYKSTSVKNFINVFEKYVVDPENLNYCSIKEEFENYSFTSLVELLPVDVNEINDNYNSKMSIKEIRKTKLISQLTDNIKERIEKYNYVVNLLKNEVEKFGKTIIKYRIIKEKYNLDDFNLDSVFEYGYDRFYVESNMSDFLKLNFKEVSKEIKDEEIIELFQKFLVNVEKEYIYDQKREQEKKTQKQAELEKKKLPYEEKNMYSLTYHNNFLFSMLMYLEYVILKSDKCYYDLKVRKYKDKELYEYPIFYNDVEVGVFGYNAENMETYFKFEKKELESNNSLDKKHDLYYFTIDKDDKRCDLFSSNTFDLIKRYYNSVQKEEVEECVENN